MSFDALLIHRVTIRRMTPAARDARFGEKKLTHDPDGDVTTRARVDPGPATENVIDREQQREEFLVFLPPDVEVSGSDEVYWIDRDVTLRADGDPIESHDGIGLHHLELAAFRIRE